MLQTRQTQPDLELAQREINEKVDKVIRAPYFAHIDYKYGTDIYIGKQQVGAWIIDWADERASLYYQWQMYIGNKEQQLELVRDIHISDGNYIGYTDLYNALQGKIKGDSFGDQHLAQIIEANQNNIKIHDIIDSIQQNQYQIISSDMNKPLLVLGCAGSGKTMILMHKIRYMKYNHKDLKMNDVIVLSPTDILSRESHELSRLLQIEAAGQFTIASFFEMASKQLLEKLNLPYDEFHVIDNGINPKSYYESDYLNNLQMSLSSIQHSMSSQKDLLKEWQEQLKQKISSYIERSTLSAEEVEKLYFLYLKALKETDQAGTEEVKQLIYILEKRIAERSKYENAQLVVHMLLHSHILRDVPQLTHRENEHNEHLEKKFFYTLNVSSFIMGDVFLRGMEHQEFVPQSMAQCLQIIQLFLSQRLDRDGSRKLLNEWKKLSHQEAEAFETVLKQQIDHLYYLEEKKELLEELLRRGMIRRKNATRSNLNYETAFENLTRFYVRSRETLDTVGLEPFSFFATYNRMHGEKERLRKQRKDPNQNVYLLDAIFRLLDIQVSYNKPTEVPLPKAFLMISLLTLYTGALSSDKKYIFIDEFQDLSPKELILIHKLYPNAIFNLFGDFGQCISEKGICEMSAVPQELHIQTQKKISENYRNARQITDYVNQAFQMHMLPVGLDGIQKIVDSLPTLEIEKDDRVAIIVSGTPSVLETFVQNHSVSFFKKQGKIIRGVYNVIPVANVKGLEFEKVIVVLSGMSQNEQYVACTRAIKELYVLPA